MERERESKDKDKRRTKYFDPPDQIPEPTPRGQRQARGPAKEGKEGKEMEMESFGETELGDVGQGDAPEEASPASCSGQDMEKEAEPVGQGDTPVESGPTDTAEVLHSKCLS